MRSSLLPAALCANKAACACVAVLLHCGLCLWPPPSRLCHIGRQMPHRRLIMPHENACNDVLNPQANYGAVKQSRGRVRSHLGRQAQGMHRVKSHVVCVISRVPYTAGKRAPFESCLRNSLIVLASGSSRPTAHPQSDPSDAS